MSDERAIIDFMVRSAEEHRKRGNVHDAALTLGVKVLIERLIKERDHARQHAPGILEEAREDAIKECIAIAERYASRADLHRDLRPETVALVIRDAIGTLVVSK